MIKKTLTRLLLLGTASVIGWFIYISMETPGGRIEKSAPKPSASAVQLGRGEATRFERFDGKGNLITRGSSDKTLQTSEESFVLERIYLEHRIDGKAYIIEADNMVAEDGGRVVLTTAPGHEEGMIRITEVGGMRIETKGPLIQEGDGTIKTDAFARFSFEGGRGSCVGLVYSADNYLDLKSQVVLKSDDGETQTNLIADSFLVDEVARTGRMSNVVISTLSDAQENWITAETFTARFRSSLIQGGLSMEDAALLGAPAVFVWGGGDLESSSLEICFDGTGRWAEELKTGSDAVFTTRSSDGYDLVGTGGSLVLTLDKSDPKYLRSVDRIRLDARRGEEPPLMLEGESGVQSEFLDGVIASTFIFGRPVFDYGEMKGVSGELRVLHSQEQILFSEGAQLSEKNEGVEVSGNEILVTNWNGQDKEIFAHRFVKIDYLREGGAITGTGEKLTLLPRGNSVHLEGTPAVFATQTEQVEAPLIKAREIGDNLFDLRAEEGVHLEQTTAEGLLTMDANTLDFQGGKRLLQVDGVRKAILPNQGELSTDVLEVSFKRSRNKQVIDQVQARGNVLFISMPVGEDADRVNCRADQMDWDPAEDIVTFLGIDRSMVLTRRDIDASYGKLIYNLKDGTVIGYPKKGGKDVTKVKVKDPSEKNPR